jgi:hypothetical protein
MESVLRRDLTVVGVLLAAGCAAVMVAAFLPQLYPVWIARGVDAVALIVPRRGSWQLANWLFAAGAGLTLAGLGTLTGVLDWPPAARTTSTAALALVALASVLWLATLAFRLTVTVRVVDLVAGGGTVPDWYEPVSSWAGGLWAVAALSGALAIVGYGVTVLRAGVLPAWTGWTGIGVGVLMLGLYALLRDVPPFLLYIAPAVFGVTALVRAVRG